MTTDKQYQALVEALENFTGKLIKKYDLGSVTAAMQNLTADCIAQNEDQSFRDHAIRSFAYSVENESENHRIERVGQL